MTTDDEALPDGLGSLAGVNAPQLPEPLPAPVTDTHCHLDMVRGDKITPTGPHAGWDGAERALAQAAAVNVTRVLQVGTDVRGSTWAIEAADRFDNVVASVAIHPTDAAKLAERGGTSANTEGLRAVSRREMGELDGALAEIDRLAGSSDRVRAIGETGLDFYWIGPGVGRKAQEHSFRAHIEMARRHGLALAIHDRDAHEDVLRVLADAQLPDRVIFHCYSGDAGMASHCAERGWYLSFAGPLTFKNAPALREALAAVPLSQVLVETDAPFLTPHPHRGKPNASYLMPHTVRTIADVVGADVGTVCEALQRNTERALGDW